jgi:hypothetical protein
MPISLCLTTRVLYDIGRKGCQRAESQLGFVQIEFPKFYSTNS